MLGAFGNGFEQLRQSTGLASLTVAIVSHQDVIWARGFGCADFTQGTQATADTIYGVGSVTKTFTATMLMQFVDEGKVALSDPVEKYLPGAQFKSPSGSMVSPTFLELASHTSGMPRDIADLNNIPTNIAAMVAQMQATTGVAEPGTTYEYSNFGYMVLGQVLAQVAGVTYEEYVTAHILQPLGMTSSSFSVPSVPANGYATPYTSASAADATTYIDWGFYNPSAGLITTALDMAQFMKLQFLNGSVNGVQLLTPAAVAQMQQPVTTSATGLAGSAIGWELYVPGSTGLTLVGKDGEINGFASQMVFVPNSSLGVFLMTNTLNATNEGNIPLQLLEGAETAIVQVLQAAQ